MNESPMLIQEKFLKVKDVQDMLNISRSKVYQLVEKNEIPHLRINQAIRIRQSDLEEFIANHMTG